MTLGPFPTDITGVLNAEARLLGVPDTPLGGPTDAVALLNQELRKAGLPDVGPANEPLPLYIYERVGADSIPPAQPASFPDVQVLGSLIGVGLADTGGPADATNLLQSTQQAFSGLDWYTTFATISDAGVTDPLSGSTASTMTEMTGGTPRHTTSQGFSAPGSVSYTFAVSLKQGLRTRAALVLADSLTITNFALATFDLAGGVVGIAASVGGNFTVQSAAISSQSNGFYRCTLTATVNANGNYVVQIFADAGSGAGAQNLNYAGNSGSVAISFWGAGVWSGAAGAYVPLNANVGAAGSTVQQAFVPNGVTTAYWGTKTNNAYPAFDAGVPVVYTRHRFAPRPTAPTAVGQWPFSPDYASAIAGSLIQISVSDSTFSAPTTVNAIPAVGALPYYPRYWLSEQPIPLGPAARYIRFLPPAASFGGLSAWQVFAALGTTANACPVQPVISPMGGKFPGLSTKVSITSTIGAAIYYTIDGSTPTTASLPYTGPFNLSISSGGSVIVKAIANLPSLSTPNSLVTTSSPFFGYGFKPNTDEFDDKGNLIEAHSGHVMWDPNTSAYYRVGQFMNINNVLHFTATVEPNFAPAVYLYKSTDLMNWSNLGPILGPLFPNLYGIASNYHLLYNAANNNYVIWTTPVAPGPLSSLFIATTAGPNIAGPWTWNLTPVVSNTFFNFAIMIDSDGVTAYVAWRQYSPEKTMIQQLNSSYTGLTGSPFNIASGILREGFAFFKYPNVPGGTYFMVTGQANPYNSTSANVDLRYIYSTGATPLVNSWSAVPASGADAWNGFTALGTNFNGQAFFSFLPQGKVQPFIGMDYWTTGQMYNSRQVWLPLTMTPNSLVITHGASWDPSQLASTYTLGTLTLSRNIFQVGDAQGKVIGTVAGYLLQPWVSLTDSHSGAVQLVNGVLQVGPTPPGIPTSFNITLTETPNVGPPNSTVISITEQAVAPQLNGSVVTLTTSQSLNLTTLGGVDWAAFGYNVNAASIERKSTGGSLISVLSQVGAIALQNFNGTASLPKWSSTWTDGSPDASIASEAYVVFCGPATTVGPGMSFTVPADKTVRTLDIYVTVSNNTVTSTHGKLVAHLSDSSVADYVDTSVATISSDTAAKLGHYTITYEAASNGQTLTITWTNDSGSATGQNVQISAATLN